jgi:hypothetical protein
MKSELNEIDKKNDELRQKIKGNYDSLIHPGSKLFTGKMEQGDADSIARQKLIDLQKTESCSNHSHLGQRRIGGQPLFIRLSTRTAALPVSSALPSLTIPMIRVGITRMQPLSSSLTLRRSSAT